MYIYFYVAVIGMIAGSFAGATVWRLRARQLVADKKMHVKLTIAERLELKQLKPLSVGAFSSHDRSRCLTCKHELGWKDMIPLLSWLSTRGRCRYCGVGIGWFELIVELGTASLAVLLFMALLAQDAHPVVFVLWCVASLLLVILVCYDAKWYLLPDVIVWPVVMIGLLLTIGDIVFATNIKMALLSAVGSVGILAGIYAALFYFSQWRYGIEKTWVGFGDVKLGLALALLLHQWDLAFLTLFFANVFGIFLVLPLALRGRLHRATRIPFGPLLIAGMYVSFFWGKEIIDWYLAATLLML